MKCSETSGYSSGDTIKKSETGSQTLLILLSLHQ